MENLFPYKCFLSSSSNHKSHSSPFRCRYSSFEEKKGIFRSCHCKVMKSDLFYCSECFNPLQFSQISSLRQAIMMIFMIFCIRKHKNEKHCLSKRKTYEHSSSALRFIWTESDSQRANIQKVVNSAMLSQDVILKLWSKKIYSCIFC